MAPSSSQLHVAQYERIDSKSYDLYFPLQNEVQAFFRASTYTVVGNGHCILFWEDRWINGDSVSDIAPCLYHLVPPTVRRRQSVTMGLQTQDMGAQHRRGTVYSGHH